MRINSYIVSVKNKRILFQEWREEMFQITSLSKGKTRKHIFWKFRLEKLLPIIENANFLFPLWIRKFFNILFFSEIWEEMSEPQYFLENWVHSKCWGAWVFLTLNKETDHLFSYLSPVFENNSFLFFVFIVFIAAISK